MDFIITPMRPEDWPVVEQIYLQGIATGNATFETASPGWEKWDANHHAHSRLVARNDHSTLGWAAISPVSTRAVYAGVAEVSVYVADSAKGKGIGKALLRDLIQQSERHGVWTLQASIFPENVASIELHKALGFRELGRRNRIAMLADRWRDTVLLERRSQVAGTS